MPCAWSNHTCGLKGRRSWRMQALHAVHVGWLLMHWHHKVEVQPNFSGAGNACKFPSCEYSGTSRAVEGPAQRASKTPHTARIRGALTVAAAAPQTQSPACPIDSIREFGRPRFQLMLTAVISVHSRIGWVEWGRGRPTRRTARNLCSAAVRIQRGKPA